jgi:hypothetical protein
VVVEMAVAVTETAVESWAAADSALEGMGLLRAEARAVAEGLGFE